MKSPRARLALLVPVFFLACGGPQALPVTPTENPIPAAPAPTPRRSPAAPKHAAVPAWIAKSNEHTKLLLDVMAKFSPEGAARLGVEGLDDRIVDLAPGHEARQRAAESAALAELRKVHDAESDPLVKQDLAILIHAADLSVRRSELEEKLLVPYMNLTELVFGSTIALLDDQVAPARRQAIVARYRKYAGMDGGKPISELVIAEITDAMKHPERAMPPKIELEKHLANNATMRDGLEKLLTKYAIKDYAEPHKLLLQQLTAYDDFVKKTLLPKARASFVLPPPVYAIQLEGFGVDMPPAELTKTAHEGFTKIQAEMKTVATEVAKAKNLPSSDYRDVLHALKKEQIPDDAILGLYKKRLADIEEIIKKENLVTLPARPARIRLGTPAENVQQPAPHMMPPRLLGNTGEQGEFVLPLSVPPAPGAPAKAEDQRLDDFTFDAAAWTLTAHEARPGHEMQFAAMMERGVSNARAIYAFNSANVEGWGLYAELIMYPYMPPEGKLVSLQLRLQRAARAFLDPELQQGKWTFASAKAFLMKEVGISNALATSEVERYTFRSPGQATSYYYGLLKLQDLRRELEKREGASFDAKKLHDFILGQGLLPPKLIREAALKELAPPAARSQ
jgi:uncharacterized protein (DUF885 family)